MIGAERRVQAANNRRADDCFTGWTVRIRLHADAREHDLTLPTVEAAAVLARHYARLPGTASVLVLTPEGDVDSSWMADADEAGFADSAA